MTNDLRNEIAEIVADAECSDDHGCGSFVINAEAVADAILAKLDPDALIVAALEAAAAHLYDIARNTPLGHENASRGASTYNWLRTHETLIRTLAADPEARAAIKAKVGWSE